MDITVFPTLLLHYFWAFLPGLSSYFSLVRAIWKYSILKCIELNVVSEELWTRYKKSPKNALDFFSEDFTEQFL